MKRNPYAVQSVDSGWVHGVISHEGRGPHPTAPTPSLAGGPSAKTRGRASDVRKEPVGTFQPAGGDLPSSNSNANTQKSQPRPTPVPVPIAPSEYQPPSNSGPPGQSVNRGRNASRGSNKSQIRGVSVASSTNSRKSRSGVTEGLDDAHYGAFVNQIVKLAIQKNIPRDKLIMEITTIIKNCAKYSMEQVELQIDEEFAKAEIEHQEEIDTLKQTIASNTETHVRILEQHKEQIQSQHRQIEELLKSTSLQIHESDLHIEQIDQANLRIHELEDQINDLVQQISQSQQEHAELLADVFRKTEESRDGPAGNSMFRYIDSDPSSPKPEPRPLAREQDGSPAMREHVLRRSSTLKPRSGDGEPPGDDTSTRAPAALRRSSTFQPGGRGSSIKQRPRWT